MKKEIRLVDEKKGILQVTTHDERWYIKEIQNKETGLPEFQYVPSVTWICDHYPKGSQFYKWLASKGWDEAESIKVAAGDKGSKVHFAVKDLIEGKEIPINAKYFNPTTKQDEELTLEEYACLMSFVQWHKDCSPVFDEWEFAVWGDGYAGTVDLVCHIDGRRWLIDFKTSQYIWPSHELQVSAYKKATGYADATLGILQLGYQRNKNKYKLTEIEDQYELFEAAKKIWAKEQAGVAPFQKDYPLALKLEEKKQEEVTESKQTKKPKKGE